MGYSFDLVSKQTLNYLAQAPNILLPAKNLNQAKDEAWNKKLINSQLFQGIKQGESIPDLAKRIQSVTGSNQKASIKYARTMATAAQNKGRLNAMIKAQKDGIKQKKMWMSTHDERTRDSHITVDGQQVKLNEKFANGLMFPGDPAGKPSEVYNCRCTMVSVVEFIDGTMIDEFMDAAWDYAVDSIDFWEAMKKQKAEEYAKKQEALKFKKMSKLDKEIYDLEQQKIQIESDIQAIGYDATSPITLKDVVYPKLSDYTPELRITATFKQKALQKEIDNYKQEIEWKKQQIEDIKNDPILSQAEKKFRIQLKQKIIDQKIQHAAVVKAEWLEIDKWKTNGKAYYQKYKPLKEKLTEVEQKISEAEQKKAVKEAANEIKKIVKEKNQVQKEKDVIQAEYDEYLKHEKEYSNIWQTPKKPSDYDPTDVSLQNKLNYFENKIKHGQSLNDQAMIDKFTKLKSDLEQFTSESIAAHVYKTKLKEFDIKLNDYGAKINGIKTGKNSINYTQERKDNAYYFKDKRAADNAVRDKCGEVWRSLDEYHKDGIYKYTHTYHCFNEPLRGIEYGTSKVIGRGEKAMASSSDRAGIRTITEVIDKSFYNFDIWLQRGCGFRGMKDFLNIDENLLYYGSEAELQQALLGTTVTEYGFMSTGIAKGSGFTGDVMFNIFAPSGTKMMYLEPFSAFGYGSGRNWDGVSTQGTIGHEAEMLLQQGTKFRVSKITRQGSGTIYIDLEVIGTEAPQF